MQYWLILYEQEDGTYKYYIGQSGDGASVCKLTFADDGSEYKPPSGKTLLKVAREEADAPVSEHLRSKEATPMEPMGTVLRRVRE